MDRQTFIHPLGQNPKSFPVGEIAEMRDREKKMGWRKGGVESGGRVRTWGKPARAGQNNVTWM